MIELKGDNSNIYSFYAEKNVTRKCILSPCNSCYIYFMKIFNHLEIGYCQKNFSPNFLLLHFGLAKYFQIQDFQNAELGKS